MKANLLKIAATLFVVLINFPMTYAQEGDTLSIQRNRKGEVEFVRFKENANSDRKMKNDTTFLKSMLKVRKDDGFRLMNESTDALGITHKRFQQYYKGIKVDNAQYLVHGKNNEIDVANGDFQEIDIQNVKPVITEKEALQKALDYINAEIYKWQVPEEEDWLKTNFKESYYPAGELVISKDHLKTDSLYCLAYKFNIYAHQPLSRNYVYVDANSGEIINMEPLIMFANTNGTADTRYSGTRSIINDSYTNGYRLRELRNNVRIETYNMQRTGSYSSTDFTNSNNNWAASIFNNAYMDNAALDAHWGAEMVYEYFRQVHGRNSWDDKEDPLLNYVHANLIALYYPNNNNAFWDGQRMTYGDGDGIIFSAWTALDICAHEIGHGVMAKSANLTNSGESGALNEGFSDIWSACIKNWAAPEKSIWLVDKDIIISPFSKCAQIT